MKRLILSISVLLGACTTAQINQTLSDANKMIGGDKPLTTAEEGRVEGGPHKRNF